MHCAEFESRLNDVLDERLWLDSDPTLTAHVQHCRVCRELAASYEAMILGLEQSKVPAPSPAIAAGVLAALPGSCTGWDAPDVIRGPFRASPQAPAARRRLPGRRSTLLALAAAAAVGAIAVFWNTVAPDFRGPSDQANPIAARSNDSPATANVAVATSREEDLAAGADLSLPNAMAFFPGGASPTPSTSGGAAKTSSWMHDVSDGLKPVTSTTASAVTSFFELLAGNDEGSRS
jgi:hypothetical protein